MEIKNCVLLIRLARFGCIIIIYSLCFWTPMLDLVQCHHQDLDDNEKQRMDQTQLQTSKVVINNGMYELKTKLQLKCMWMTLL